LIFRKSPLLQFCYFFLHAPVGLFGKNSRNQIQFKIPIYLIRPRFCIFDEMKIAGLTDLEITQLQAVLAKIPDLERAVIFGSRTTGKHKPSSDVDIALYGEKRVFGAIFDIEEALYGLGFGPELDILLFSIIQDPRLKAAIDRTAVEVFTA
jgi:predicted nucleotidyltransferase